MTPPLTDLISRLEKLSWPDQGLAELRVLASMAEGVERQRVEESGFWRTCSGCHETEDGYDVGHYSTSITFQCKLGGGCSECGGIGAIWDDTDYDDMAAWVQRRDKEREARKALLLHEALAADAAECVMSDPDLSKRLSKAAALLRSREEAA